MAKQLGQQYAGSKVRLKLNYSRWRDASLAPHVARNMSQAMDFLRDRVQEVVSTPGFGIPSKPGQPPHLQSGAYRKSIQALVHRTDLNSIVGRVGSNSPYARRLEKGFVGRDKLGRNYNQAPRPHMAVTAKRYGAQITAILNGG
jgi:hypothetical protein